MPPCPCLAKREPQACAGLSGPVELALEDTGRPRAPQPAGRQLPSASPGGDDAFLFPSSHTKPKRWPRGRGGGLARREPAALAQRRRCSLAGAVPAGKDQGERQSGEPGRGRGDHREEQEQDHGHVRGPVLKEVRRRGSTAAPVAVTRLLPAPELRRVAAGSSEPSVGDRWREGPGAASSRCRSRAWTLGSRLRDAGCGAAVPERSLRGGWG